MPVRIEIGPRDLKHKQVVAVRRDTGEKLTFPEDDITSSVTTLLYTIQNDLFLK